MKTKLLFAVAVCTLSACSWVDSTGSQSNDAPLIGDGEPSDALLFHRDEGEAIDIEIDDSDRVDTRFTLASEGHAADKDCDFGLTSAASLADACQRGLDASQCQLRFVAEPGGVRYRATVPPLRNTVALNYRIVATDSNGATTTRDAQLCLHSVNTPPRAADQRFQVDYLGALELPGVEFDGQNCEILGGQGLLRNASDDFDLPSASTDGPACLWAELATAPRHAIAGSFSVDRLGALRYRPDASLAPGDLDSFNYTVTDGQLRSPPATVTIEVVGANRPPLLAEGLQRSLLQGTTLVLRAGELGSDPEGGALFLSALGRPAGGSAILTDGGAALRYTPAPDFSGDDNLAFTLSDPAGATTGGELRVEVVAGNQPPRIGLERDTLRVTSQQQRSLMVDVGDAESPLGELRLSASSSNPAVATASVPAALVATGNAIIVTANAIGDATLTLRLSDGGLNGPITQPPRTTTATVRVIVEPIPNRAPRAGDGELRTAVGATATIDLNTLASDPDGDPLRFELINPPNGAALDDSTLRVTGARTGRLAIDYRAIDPDDAEARATVTVNVDPAPNRAPRAGDGELRTAVGATAAIDLNTLASDPDGDPLRFELINPPNGAALDGSTLRVTGARTGRLAIDYRAIDPDDAEARATVTVNVDPAPNRAPRAGDGELRTAVGATATIDLNTLASDPDGDPLRFELINPPNGAALDDSTLRVTGTRTGRLAIDYRAIDPDDAEARATVTVNVDPADDTADEAVGAAAGDDTDP